MPCYETGPVFSVQYLPELTYTSSQNCYTGTVTVQPAGGLPSINATQYGIVSGSLSPPTASFVNTTCGIGGSIQLTGLTNGQSYSFELTDNSGCSITVSGVFSGLTPVTLSYPQINYCIDDAPTNATVTGSSGGTFN